MIKDRFWPLGHSTIKGKQYSAFKKINQTDI